jgi:hypothetical protein
MVGLAILLGTRGACLAGPEEAAAASVVASACDDNADPYSVIAKRNVFGLNPPPPPPEPAKGPQPDVPGVYLSGFMRKGDQLKVLLVLKVRNPDTRAAPLNAYLTLAEGDKKVVMSMNDQVLVQLVRVYAGQEKVDVIIAGTPMTLSLKDNSFGSPTPRPETSPSSAMTAALRKRHRFSPPPALPPVTAEAAATPVEPEKHGGGDSLVAGVPPSSEGAALPDREATDTSNAIIVGGTGAAPP